MGEKFYKEIEIAPSRADATGKMGFADCFDLFMDMASEHAGSLGVGLNDLGRMGQFWLTVKSKVVFKRRPMISEKVTISTWPESNNGGKVYRCYEIARGSETLALGKTEWAVFDLNTGRPVVVDDLYPQEYNVIDDRTVGMTFNRITGEFPEEAFATYKVNANDIDLGHHMNNVAYIRALQSLYTVDEWKRISPLEIEIQYRKPCFEGETIEFRKKIEGDSLIVQGRVGDKVVALYKLVIC